VGDDDLVRRAGGGEGIDEDRHRCPITSTGEREHDLASHDRVPLPGQRRDESVYGGAMLTVVAEGSGRLGADRSLTMAEPLTGRRARELEEPRRRHPRNGREEDESQE